MKPVVNVLHHRLRVSGAALVCLMVISGRPACAAQAPRSAEPATVMQAVSDAVGTPSVLSAQEAVSLAIDNALQMRTQRIDLDLQVSNDVNVVRRQFLPKFAFSVTGGRKFSSNTQPANRLTTDSLTPALQTTWAMLTGAKLSLTQTLDRQQTRSLPGERTDTTQLDLVQPLAKGAGLAVNSANERMSRASLRAVAYSFQQQATDLAYQVLSKYFDRQTTYTRVQQLKNALAEAERVQEINRALVQAGRLASSSLLQNKVDIAQARLELAQAQQDDVVALRDLAALIGLPQASPEFETRDELMTLMEASLRALDERHAYEHALGTGNVMAARESVEVASQQALVADDNMRLPLDLRLTHTQSRLTAMGNTSKDTFLGLSFEYNFDRAELKQAQSSARAGLLKAQMQLSETERTVRYAVMDALTERRFSEERSALAQMQEASAKERFDAEVERMTVGRASALDVSIARQTWSSAQTQALQAKTQVLLAQLNLLRLTGGLLTVCGVADRVKGWTDVAFD